MKYGQKEKGTRADVEVCERNYTLGRNMESQVQNNGEYMFSFASSAENRLEKSMGGDELKVAEGGEG